MASEENIHEEDLIHIPLIVDVPYRFAAGPNMGKFLYELKENKRFFAIRCPKCGRVQLPPRVVCATCHVQNEGWVEVGPEGSVSAYQIMYIPLTDPTTGEPHEPPFVYCTVHLDGCDSSIDHFLNMEPEFNKLWVGMRVRPVFHPDDMRKGDLSDIRYFDPLPGQEKPNKDKE